MSNLRLGWGVFLLPLFACSAERMREADIDAARPCRITELGVLPLTISHNHVWIPVTVDGRSGPALLDTGSFASYVSPDHVKPVRHDFGGMIGTATVSGPRIAIWRWIGAFSIGPLHWNRDVKVIVSAVPGASDVGESIAGVGVDFLGRYDYDLDFPNERVAIYATDNCLHPDPPWQTMPVGLPIARIEHGFGLTIPVQFEAGSLSALIDTGAGYTTLSRRAAHKLGLTDRDIASGPPGHVDDIFKNFAQRPFHWHRFAEMVIGQELLKNQDIAILDGADATDEQVDMVLGMDYLRHHHVWLSLSTDALFIDSGQPKPPAPAKSGA